MTLDQDHISKFGLTHQELLELAKILEVLNKLEDSRGNAFLAHEPHPIHSEGRLLGYACPQPDFGDWVFLPNTEETEVEE